MLAVERGKATGFSICFGGRVTELDYRMDVRGGVASKKAMGEK